jgi:integrase
MERDRSLSPLFGRVDDVKTEYSHDFVPLAPELVRRWFNYCEIAYPTKEGWLFANPRTSKPYHREEIQKKHIRRAANAAGTKDNIGWHTFRHRYRSWLDQAEAPIGVQKELTRHASIQTTMNVYGRAMTENKRQAHNNVVQMVVKADAANNGGLGSASNSKTGPKAIVY